MHSEHPRFEILQEGPAFCGDRFCGRNYYLLRYHFALMCVERQRRSWVKDPRDFRPPR